MAGTLQNHSSTRKDLYVLRNKVLKTIRTLLHAVFLESYNGAETDYNLYTCELKDEDSHFQC